MRNPHPHPCLVDCVWTTAAGRVVDYSTVCTTQLYAARSVLDQSVRDCAVRSRETLRLTLSGVLSTILRIIVNKP